MFVLVFNLLEASACVVFASCDGSLTLVRNRLSVNQKCGYQLIFDIIWTENELMLE